MGKKKTFSSLGIYKFNKLKERRVYIKRTFEKQVAGLYFVFENSESSNIYMLELSNSYFLDIFFDLHVNFRRFQDFQEPHEL